MPFGRPRQKTYTEEELYSYSLKSLTSRMRSVAELKRALPLLAIWTAGLATARERQEAPNWWLLPLILLWANLHGSFAFGLALAGALAVEAVEEAVDRRKAAMGWGLFLLAATVSAMATPF